MKTRLIIIILLVIAIIAAVFVLRAKMSPTAIINTEPLTAEEQEAVLERLNNPTEQTPAEVKEQQDILDSLSATSSASAEDQQKILESLQAK